MTLQEKEQELREQLDMIQEQKKFYSKKCGMLLLVAKAVDISPDPTLYMESKSIHLSTLKEMVKYYDNLVKKDTTKLGELL